MSCSCCERCANWVGNPKFCIHFYFCNLRRFEFILEERIRDLVDSFLQTDYKIEFGNVFTVRCKLSEIVEENEKELERLQENEMYSDAMLETSVNYMDGLYRALPLFEDLHEIEEKSYQAIIILTKEILVSTLD